MCRHAVVLAAALVWFVNIERAEAKLDILVDKSTQRMIVMQDGFVRYMWPVSTGRDNMATPNGVYSPQRLERNWFSTAYYNSPMPFSIFFHNGYAIHGSYAIDRLGGPASHGCVRLHPHHAAILFDLVQREGPSSTTIDITDQGRPPERPVSGRDIVEGAARDPALVPPRDIAMGPTDIPPVPKVIRYRENGETPDLLPAPRANRSIVAKNNLPPPPLVAPPPTQASRRLPPPDVKPPASPPRPRIDAGAANTANGSSRSPSEPSDARSKIAVVEGSKVADGPKVQAVSPGPTEPAQSASGFKLLPASCWSGGASRWKWWSSGQENSCR